MLLIIDQGGGALGMEQNHLSTYFSIIKHLPGRNMKFLVPLIFTMCIRIDQGSTQSHS